MVRTQIQLTEEQAAELRRLARETGQSVAELIRQSVDRMLSGASAAGDEERRRRAIAAIGSLRSSEGDLAEDHNRYLAEAYRA
jgi:hypothetical protein